MNDNDRAADFNRKFLAALSVLLIVLSFGYVFTITLVPLSKDAVQFANITLGFVLGTVVGTICGFFFGNSKQRENAPAAAIAPAKATDAPVQAAASQVEGLTP